jgi:hypothetical protein
MLVQLYLIKYSINLLLLLYLCLYSLVVLELQVRGPIQPTEKACKALWGTAWGSA